MPHPDRRGFLGVLATLAGAGCASSSGTDDAVPPGVDVLVGPGGRVVFEPEELSVAVGDTVTWLFESPGHNVSCRPADSELASLPDAAEPFATYGPDESPGSLVQAGEGFEHTFSVPGTYVYVCIPHVPDGMIGRIAVEP